MFLVQYALIDIDFITNRPKIVELHLLTVVLHLLHVQLGRQGWHVQETGNALSIDIPFWKTVKMVKMSNEERQRAIGMLLTATSVGHVR